MNKYAVPFDLTQYTTFKQEYSLYTGAAKIFLLIEFNPI